MKKFNSIKAKIWIYLTGFTVLIITLLWLFQVVFLDSYYKYSRVNLNNDVINKIEKEYNGNNIEDVIDSISHEHGVCIEVVENSDIVYTNSNNLFGCIVKSSDRGIYNIGEIIKFKNDFSSGNITHNNQEIYDTLSSDSMIISGVKLDNNTTVFVTAALQPMGATVDILASQLVIVSIIVIILALIVGYFISKKISKPIIKITSSANELSKGNFDTVFEIDEDIKELNDLTKTLTYTRYELEQTENLRRELLANISHDLKTPLTMIRAYAEMMRDLPDISEDKKCDNLNIIIDESDRLNNLVNDILDLSKASSNVEKLDLETVNIYDLVNTIIKRFDYLKEQENYKFKIIGQKDTLVNCDKKKIEQVIYNLLSNAINYTGDNKLITIKLILNDNIVRLEVIDTGKGIKEEDLKKIWTKYYSSNVDHKRNKAHTSTGIGLSIVKEILVSHKSNYGVNSKKDKGTTFYFELEKVNK